MRRRVKLVNSVDRPLYPEARQSYANKVGNTGELAVEVTFCDYLLSRPGVNVKGADLVSDSHSIGIEVWNHSKAYAYVERVESVIKNLSGYENKFLVTSFISEGIRETIEHNGITVITLGFQILPAKYFTFYLEYGGMNGKRILTLRTLKILKNRLAPIERIIEEKCTSTETYGYSDTHVCNDLLFPIEPHISIKCPSTREHNKPISNGIQRISPAKISRLTENKALTPRLPEQQNKNILNLLTLMLFLLPIYTMSKHFSRRMRETAIVMFTFLILQIIKLLKIKQVNTPIPRAHYTNEQKLNTSKAHSVTPTSYINRLMIEFYAAIFIGHRCSRALYRWSKSLQEEYDTHYHWNSKTIHNEAFYQVNSQFTVDRSLSIGIYGRLTGVLSGIIQKSIYLSKRVLLLNLMATEEEKEQKQKKQKKRKKKKQKLVLLTEEEIVSETFPELLRLLEELEKEGKFVDIQICPRCKSARVKRIRSMEGDMSSHLSITPVKYECLDCGWRERLVLKATNRPFGFKEMALIAEALDFKEE